MPARSPEAYQPPEATSVHPKHEILRNSYNLAPNNEERYNAFKAYLTAVETSGSRASTPEDLGKEAAWETICQPADPNRPAEFVTQQIGETDQHMWVLSLNQDKDHPENSTVIMVFGTRNQNGNLQKRQGCFVMSRAGMARMASDRAPKSDSREDTIEYWKGALVRGEITTQDYAAHYKKIMGESLQKRWKRQEKRIKAAQSVWLKIGAGEPERKAEEIRRAMQEVRDTWDATEARKFAGLREILGNVDRIKTETEAAIAETEKRKQKELIARQQRLIRTIIQQVLQGESVSKDELEKYLKKLLNREVDLDLLQADVPSYKEVKKVLGKKGIKKAIKKGKRDYKKLEEALDESADADTDVAEGTTKTSESIFDSHINIVVEQLKEDRSVRRVVKSLQEVSNFSGGEIAYIVYTAAQRAGRKPEALKTIREHLEKQLGTVMVFEPDTLEAKLLSHEEEKREREKRLEIIETALSRQGNIRGQGILTNTVRDLVTQHFPGEDYNDVLREATNLLKERTKEDTTPVVSPAKKPTGDTTQQPEVETNEQITEGEEGRETPAAEATTETMVRKYTQEWQERRKHARMGDEKIKRIIEKRMSEDPTITDSSKLLEQVEQALTSSDLGTKKPAIPTGKSQTAEAPKETPPAAKKKDDWAVWK